MIYPHDVSLIIFDMDGTILPSLPAVYEAIRRAFARLGWPVTFGQEDIRQFFGAPSSTAPGGGLFDFIIPPGSSIPRAEVRERISAEYPSTFREMAPPFPRVKETLRTLRERGYRLALYTNSSTRYMNMVLSALDIREFFDYAECIQDNNLTKPELIRKIREKFGGLTTAIVGDRIHDIEAARETESLSVGVLFGYGGSEPEQADFTINKFDDLLFIFDRKPAS